MDGLYIKYGTPKIKKVGAVIIGIYLAAFCLYFLIIELIEKRYSILFFSSLVGALLSIALILSSVFTRKPMITINNSEIISNISGSSAHIEWTSVSKVNMGVSYVVFFLNGGQKLQRLDLAILTYKDMKAVKDKITEISEFKNIPYQND